MIDLQVSYVKTVKTHIGGDDNVNEILNKFFLSVMKPNSKIDNSHSKNWIL